MQYYCIYSKWTRSASKRETLTYSPFIKISRDEYRQIDGQIIPSKNEKRSSWWHELGELGFVNGLQKVFISDWKETYGSVAVKCKKILHFEM